MSDFGLLFFLDEDFSDEDAALLHELVSEMMQTRKWSQDRPVLVDETDFQSCTRPEDEPIRTTGGFLTLRRPDEANESASEKAQFEDVDFLVRTLASFSAARHCEIGIEYGGEYIGEIRDGIVSRAIAFGLLHEWRKRL